MTYKTVKDILLKNPKAEIERGIIEQMNVNIIGHFGNLVCLHGTILAESGWICGMGSFSGTKNIGYVIRAIADLLDLDTENGFLLSRVKNIPVRIIVCGNVVVGIGSAIRDKFVLYEDLEKIEA